ncbi:MAG: S41 family peptidase [Butyribacter sp.]|nr:S41 family peptidase [bacterium]MDY3854102.1 S41 family peptidase [Butyribacter sp.]
MKNKNFLKGFLLGILSSVAGMFLFIMLVNGGVLNLTGGNSGSHAALRQKINSKVNVLEAYIDKYFLDDIDEEKMATSVYKGVINGLGDDYAAYYTAEEYKEIMEKTDGIYCGIGAYIATDTKTGLVSIVKPIKNSPAEKAGIKAGDLIYAVDGKEVTGEEISSVQALVKGEKGTKVVLTIVRKDEQKKVTVTRDEIEEDTVSCQLLDEQIGYIQVTGFESVTPNQFKNALKKLEKKDMKALIIDLRDNGGGLLDAAVEMLDQMLPKGVVVYSKDKEGNKQEYYAEDDDCFKKPLAILVNGNSASASEVFAGAIQDEEAGKLIGTTTFGKGIVQGLFGLKDGSAVKMTTAKYYTPKGRNIHGKGLTPDIKVEQSDEKNKLPVSKKEVDNQIKAAYDYLLQEIAK